MKLLKKSIVKLDNPVSVYDLETASSSHNFCLSNGAVVHNSKDLSDSLANAVFNLYQNIKTAQMISGRFNTQTQMSILDAMGWSDSDPKSEVIARITRNIYNT